MKPINLLTAQFLTTQTHLQTTNLSHENTLPLLTHLRRTYTLEQASALLTLARLRQRAVDKFPNADQLFFTQEALEQATAWPIAEHRARWIDENAPPGPVLDLGCGVGGDMLALAHYRDVIAYDLDPVRLHFAQVNAERLGLADRVEFHQADWTEALATGRLPDAAAAFADPSRRVNGKRVFSLHQMQPSIGPLLQLQQQIPALGVKVMPGVQDEELPSSCGIEFISHAGVCKEAVLWFGSLAKYGRWASVCKGLRNQPSDSLPSRLIWSHICSSGEPPPLGALSAGQFLYEPDAAVIRAGAFIELSTRLDAHLFDSQIAYLVSDQFKKNSLVQSFEIQEVHPFNLKHLNRRLNALGIGQVELKKRGVPFEPESLRKRIKLVDGGRAGVVIFTRRGDDRLMLIGQRVTQS